MMKQNKQGNGKGYKADRKERDGERFLASMTKPQLKGSIR